MKVVILAGGFGTRISEETEIRPKPMIEIDGKPILWHIMKIYSHFGFNDFIICCGYKGYMIKEYFKNYSFHQSDVTFNFENDTTTFHNKRTEPWKVTLLDTGDKSMTGGRLKRVKEFLINEDEFFLTYGDGLSDIDMNKLLNFHRSHSKLATISAVPPPGRFGALEMEDNLVKVFNEKPSGDGGLINGGFFVLSPKVLDLIEDDQTVWEQEPLKILAKEKELVAFQHDGFWHPMDTLRDKVMLEELCSYKKGPWQLWK
ncbi:MAG: glucose-1-phosphate cytidylyltransferase [Amylibacter sp.]